MKAKTKMSIVVLAALFAAQLRGQSTETNKNEAYSWGLELELIQPFVPTVEIINLQFTRKLFETEKGQTGELIMGAYLRPNVEHDVVREIDEYMLLLAYRHYFWKGLHAEAGLNIGYYWGWENLIDGKDYQGVGIFWETNLGYKFNIGRKKHFYILPQFGALGNIMADIGPRGGKPDNFIQGNLFVGINF